MELELSYALIADNDVARTRVCLDVLRPFKVGVLVARDGEQAQNIIQRFGPPLLLIIDLALPTNDAFSVIKAVRETEKRPTDIIAWSPVRELTAFASERLSTLNVRILRASVGTPVLHAAVDRALRRAMEERAASRPAVDAAAERTHETMQRLADKTRQLCGTAGVAVYLKSHGEAQFRALVTWSSDGGPAQSPYYMPQIFDWVLESGEPLVFPDVAAEQLPIVSTTTSDAIRGLVAVPILEAAESGGSPAIVGTICAFDVQPLNLDSDVIEKLKALGRQVVVDVDAPETPASPPAVQAAPDHPKAAAQSEPERKPPAPSAAPAPRSVLDRQQAEWVVAREWARTKRQATALTVVLFAIDPVDAAKAANEENWRELLNTIISRTARESDLAIRWDTCELVVVLPGTSFTGARLVAERIRVALQVGSGFQMAVSAGIAEWQDDPSFDALLGKAREKVRLARASGHNRVA